jgi:hypothetical protein
MTKRKLIHPSTPLQFLQSGATGTNYFGLFSSVAVSKATLLLILSE